MPDRRAERAVGGCQRPQESGGAERLEAGIEHVELGRLASDLLVGGEQWLERSSETLHPRRLVERQQLVPADHQQRRPLQPGVAAKGLHHFVRRPVETVLLDQDDLRVAAARPGKARARARHDHHGRAMRPELLGEGVGGRRIVFDEHDAPVAEDREVAVVVFVEVVEERDLPALGALEVEAHRSVGLLHQRPDPGDEVLDGAADLSSGAEYEARALVLAGLHREDAALQFRLQDLEHFVQRGLAELHAGFARSVGELPAERGDLTGHLVGAGAALDEGHAPTGGVQPSLQVRPVDQDDNGYDPGDGVLGEGREDRVVVLRGVADEQDHVRRGDHRRLRRGLLLRPLGKGGVPLEAGLDGLPHGLTGSDDEQRRQLLSRQIFCHHWQDAEDHPVRARMSPRSRRPSTGTGRNQRSSPPFRGRHRSSANQPRSSSKRLSTTKPESWARESRSLRRYL